MSNPTPIDSLEPSLHRKRHSVDGVDIESAGELRKGIINNLSKIQLYAKDNPTTVTAADEEDIETAANNIMKLIATQTAKLQAETYDEALHDLGYDKRQVGPVTREIVDGKRQKYRIDLEREHKIGEDGENP